MILLVLTVFVVGCEQKDPSFDEGVWSIVAPKGVSHCASPPGVIRVYVVKDLEDMNPDLMNLVNGTPRIKSSRINCELVHSAENVGEISHTYSLANENRYIIVRIWEAGAERKVAFQTYKFKPK